MNLGMSPVVVTTTKENGPTRKRSNSSSMKCRNCKNKNCKICKNCCNPNRKKRCGNRICHRDKNKLERYILHHDWIVSVREQHRIKLGEKIRKEGGDNIPEEDRSLYPSLDMKINPLKMKRFVSTLSNIPSAQQRTRWQKKANSKRQVCKNLESNEKVLSLLNNDDKIIYSNISQPIFSVGKTLDPKDPGSVLTSRQYTSSLSIR